LYLFQRVKQRLNAGLIKKRLKKHTKIYMDAFGYSIADFIPCEVCGSKSVSTHHIEARKMGGRPLNDLDRIENLMAICRDCDVALGDKKFFKESLFIAHKEKMINKGVKFDSDWINEQIRMHGVLKVI
jgi:hypothetical protein